MAYDIVDDAVAVRSELGGILIGKGYDDLRLVLKRGISEHGGTYALSSHAETMVRAAARAYSGNITFLPDMLPTPDGFLWSEEPLNMLVRPGSEQHAIHGFVWSSTNVWTAESPDIPALAIVPITRSRSHIGPVSILPISLGYVYGEGDPNRYDEPWKFLVSLLLFMNDKILTTTTRHASRAAQRRIARANGADIGPVPTAKIIELRKREYVQGETREATDREYTCQWIVRGHWRNQWYASQGIHQPKWIVPHVKGPTDKPLKAPTQNVFAVVR